MHKPFFGLANQQAKRTTASLIRNPYRLQWSWTPLATPEGGVGSKALPRTFGGGFGGCLGLGSFHISLLYSLASISLQDCNILQSWNRFSVSASEIGLQHSLRRQPANLATLCYFGEASMMWSQILIFWCWCDHHLFCACTCLVLHPKDHIA